MTEKRKKRSQECSSDHHCVDTPRTCSKSLRITAYMQQSLRTCTAYMQQSLRITAYHRVHAAVTAYHCVHAAVTAYMHRVHAAITAYMHRVHAAVTAYHCVHALSANVRLQLRLRQELLWC